MEDKKGEHGGTDNTRAELEERKSEATSEETLSDVSESQKDNRAVDSPADSGPSPDGQLDESDEAQDAGPM